METRLEHEAGALEVSHVVPLGTLLVQQGLLDEATLDRALLDHTRSGEPLGRVLLASGAISRLDLYRTLAGQWGIPFVDLTGVRPDRELLDRAGIDQVLRWAAVPFERRGRRVLVAVTSAPTPPRREALAAWLGCEPDDLDLRATTDWDLDWAVRHWFDAQLADRATNRMRSEFADFSAHRVFTRRQQVVGLGFLVVTVLLIALWWQATLAAILFAINAMFFVGVVFRYLVSLRGVRERGSAGVTPDDVEAVPDHELPLYTILVPVYREEGIVAHLVSWLAQLDYPPEKLEILLLLESDDTLTIEAAKAAAPPDVVRFLVIPDGLPKTKPKACNVGLSFARGEFLVIYDAEDLPEPDQLRKAVAAFRAGGEDLVCVQAALNYFNADQNVLTRMFTLEYSFWFDYMLPGLDAWNLPIPLGGTSNHFRTERLRELGGWDPYNVTEDADLGIRAAAAGQRVAVLDSTTFEEANSRVGNFVRQRSRWIKGYMQTTLVHSRHPVRLVRTIGWRSTLGFLALIGGTPAMFLIAPLLWALFVARVVFGLGEGALYWDVTAVLSLVNLLVGNALAVYLSMLAVFGRRRFSLVLWALLNPLYWVLHSVASYKALWQLLVRPFYWEKTQHGLTVAPSAGSAP